MNINFLNPQSTERGCEVIKQLHRYLSSSLPNASISTGLKKNHLNITYGYLGFFSRLLHQSPNTLYHPYFPPSFIIDHSYSCEATKYSLFRLCSMNTSLNSLSFGSQFVIDSHKNAIYQSLLSTQELNSLEISYPLSSFTLSASTPISLLIKLSSVASSIIPFSDKCLGPLNAHQLVSSWLNAKRTSSVETQFITDIKPWESTLLPSTGEVRFRQHQVVRSSIKFDHLSEVVCPHSMFCVPFILNLVPTYLSSNHPLHSYLGSYVHFGSYKEALDATYNAILNISVSLPRFAKMMQYLIDLSKYT